MDRFFNADNKVFQALGSLMDCMIISALWLLMCIPVFTIGTSTTAMYTTVHKVIRRQQGYVWNTFWDSFNENFKLTTKLWLIILAIIIVLTADIYVTHQALVEGLSWGIFAPFFVILMILVILWAVYIFAYSARFEQTLKATLKNGVLLMIANLPWTVLIFLELAVATIVTMYMPILIIILPGIATVLVELILEHVFRKLMTEEQRRHEEEEDMQA